MRKRVSKNPDMKRSYLIQRLLRPVNKEVLGMSVDNLFAFGGGLVNGGMSKEGMDAIRNIFAFDYMGAAEFEFGAVPQALSDMVQQHKNLVAFTVEVETKQEPPSNYPSDKSLNFDAVKAPVYVICLDAHKDEVTARVKGFARRNYGHDTKEAVMLNQTIRRKAGEGKSWNDYVGWLEINNAYMFFSDKETWEKMCKLFGVES